jgi:uncharacterized protein
MSALNCGPLWLLAIVMGVTASGHCLGMCGSLAPALARLTSPEQPNQRPRLTSVWLNLGRLCGYVLWGMVLGASAHGLIGILPLMIAGYLVRIAVGVALLLLAVRVYRGREDRLSAWLGRGIWNRVKPALGLLQQLPPPCGALAGGIIWSLLPCGMVYSMLLMAVASASPWQGALVLGCFGLGTLPTMVALTVGLAPLSAVRALQAPHHWLRPVLAAVVLLWAGWNLHDGIAGLIQ